MNKKNGLLIVAIILILAGVWVVAGYAQQGPWLPEGVQTFHVDGRTFVRDTELGILVHWCTNECGGCDVCEPCSTPTNEPGPQPTPDPTSTPNPDPTPTPKPEPTDKPKCNRGLGNLSEGCDPGNSGGKPGSAGEENE